MANADEQPVGTTVVWTCDRAVLAAAGRGELCPRWQVLMIGGHLHQRCAEFGPEPWRARKALALLEAK